MNEQLDPWLFIVKQVGNIADRPWLLKRGGGPPLKVPDIRQILEHAASLLNPDHYFQLKPLVCINTYRNHLKAAQEDGRIDRSVRIGARRLKTGIRIVFLYRSLPESTSFSSS